VRVVLDTNVLVSGILRPQGPAGLVIEMAVGRRFQVCYDARIFLEYRTVLARPKFGFEPKETAQLLAVVEAHGLVCSPLPLKNRLPDRTDEAFLEVALGGEADFLVTGNRKDFPQSATGKIRVVSPAEFLEIWRSSF